MSATTILYEGLHCLFCAWLAYGLIRKTFSMPSSPSLYATTIAVVCLFLGDVYWLVHLTIRGSAPEILSACDVSYLGMWLIFHAALPRANKVTAKQTRFAIWMGIFIILNGIGWTVWIGHWLNNLIWTIPLLLLAIRSALLLDVQARPAQRSLFLLLLGLLTAAETASFLWPVYWHPLQALCAALWFLSLFQFVRILKESASFQQMSIPAWMLLLIYCECASLMSTSWIYFVFQILLTVAIGYYARIIGKEGEAGHAV